MNQLYSPLTSPTVSKANSWLTTSNNCTGHFKGLKPFGQISLLVMLALLFTGNLNPVLAQSSTCVPGSVQNGNNDPWTEECYLNSSCNEQGNPCQANDVGLVGIFLADNMGNPIPACNLGDMQSVTL